MWLLELLTCKTVYPTATTAIIRPGVFLDGRQNMA
ncbi:hypothetical protein PHMEG_00016985, partial [Phytophthora megakarya]